ncbi:E3 ubiquitin-protein ligase siah2-like [Tigriopus californicus]|uniref:E3 ubiquitin-protein ligase siah2-like n=1 Tax=Tigriopus californicus TaxID=6832 RepID=UPI0027DA52A4|nr:E3 ubiquitin-protein ligase siah2-like [Tigriopus californicus]
MQSSVSPTISVESLKEYFECPICLNVPRGSPIFQCGTGHLICAECRPKIKDCPICRAHLSRNSRLLFAERLLEECVPVPCEFADLGCPMELVSNQLKRHEAQCSYRPNLCKNHVRGCSSRLSLDEMNKHLDCCSFRLIDCPMSLCQEKVVARLLPHHLELKHLSRTLTGGFEKKIFTTLLIVCLVSLLLNYILLINLK